MVTGPMTGRWAIVLVAVMGRSRLDRAALAEVLDCEPDVAIVAVKRTAANLAAACGGVKPDVVVVLRGVAGDEEEHQVRQRFPTSHIVAIRAGDGPDGADAVVDADQSVGSLVRTMRIHAAGPPRVAVLDSETGSTARVASLTDSEVQILRLISEGRTAADIGQAIGVSAKTVDNHRRRIYDKLGVRSQTRAVAKAVRDGMLGTGAPRKATTPDP